jgi:hypothetical protein
MEKFTWPEGPDLIDAAIKSGIMTRGMWGDGTNAVCMMSALVPEAARANGRGHACVTAGWPEWLVDLNVTLFDADVGSSVENELAFEFARHIAEAVTIPRNMDKAHHLFMIRVLTEGAFSVRQSVEDLKISGGDMVEKAVELLTRRMNGEMVTDEIRELRDEIYVFCRDISAQILACDDDEMFEKTLLPQHDLAEVLKAAFRNRHGTHEIECIARLHGSVVAGQRLRLNPLLTFDEFEEIRKDAVGACMREIRQHLIDAIKQS